MSAQEILRVLWHGSGTPWWNMAVDEALLQTLNEAVLRIYGWDRPAVSLGYFQHVSVVPPGREFVRRFTGGGLVDHARDLTYTIVLPRSHPLSAAGTSAMYCAVHKAVVGALVDLGVQAKLTPVALDGDASACFQKAVAHDVICARTGGKLAGAAQRRNRQGVLHQGSVLLSKGDEHLRSSLGERLVEQISAALNLEKVSSSLTTEESVFANELEFKKYSTREWNYGPDQDK